MIKGRGVSLLLFIVVILLVVSTGIVYALEGIPTAKDKYVNDYGSILNLSQQSELRVLFSGIDSETTAEITFISVAECAPYAPSDLAIKIGQEWKVGKADRDNGLVILYCVAENKIFAATGYGLEGILPDSKIGRLLDESYVPLRDAGQVSEGIVDFSYIVSQVIIDNKEEVLSGQAGPKRGLSFSQILFLILIAFFIFRVIARIIQKSSSKKTGFWFWPIFLPSGRSGGMGGGGFGGGGFGGGGFGGGGAGR